MLIRLFYITLKNKAGFISYCMNAYSPLILFVSVIQRGGSMNACQPFPSKRAWWQ